MSKKRLLDDIGVAEDIEIMEESILPYKWYSAIITPKEQAFIANCQEMEVWFRVRAANSVEKKVKKIIWRQTTADVLSAFSDAGGDISNETSENVAVLNFYLKQKKQNIVVKRFEDCGALEFYQLKKIKDAPACEACRIGELGQSHHMEEGGCLYPNREEDD